jgi:AraC family transcriptional regulator
MAPGSVTPLVPAARRGVRRRSETIPGFVLSEVIYERDLRLPVHAHPLAGIALTLEGCSTEIFGSTHLERPTHTALYRPPQLPHGDAIGGRGARCFVIEFDEARVAAAADVAAPLGRPSAHCRGHLAQLALGAYREWIRREEAYQFVIQGLAYEMVANVIRTSAGATRTPPPLWLRRVKGFLDDNYHERIPLDALASVGGVHPVHLARAFRQHYGTSVGGYLRLRRIDVASDRLIHTRRALADIALEAGFTSHGHFCTTFKRVTGLTPGGFRRARR